MADIQDPIVDEAGENENENENENEDEEEEEDDFENSIPERRPASSRSRKAVAR